ncbi:homing endonuclease [Burkholderia phage BcepSaruman]|uniref:GIY-YIG endonuclease n=1 Tax=Burkholderia phage BcepSaruman TaxID=2530032 RepID=A0A4D5ZD72_9CAUD|nr:homing endonuclease [Burkholderia phage BcepSaruman]QBX06649.1 GIY-YIG endonuclease [Burkholderia phage BcepSaruman]
MSYKGDGRVKRTYEQAVQELAALGRTLISSEAEYYESPRTVTIGCRCGAVLKQSVSVAVRGKGFCVDCRKTSDAASKRSVVTKDGVFATVAEAAAFYGIDHKTVYARLSSGYSDAAAVGLELHAAANASRDLDAIGYVYKITNTVNGLVYIGLTTLSVAERYKGHLAACKDGIMLPMYIDMRKYGYDKFRVRCLAKVPVRELPDTERRLIEKHHATDPKFGYNSVAGGSLGGTGLGMAVEYEGRVFHTRKAFAKHIGHGYATVTELLKLGMTPVQVAEECEARAASTVQEKLAKKLGRAVVINGVEYNSIRAACRALGVDNNTVTRRLHQGWSLESAFDTRKFTRGDSPHNRKADAR